jgi:peptide/nickel transport system substrate-binding protein/oligopeptide transport system substrate-binding protein
LAGFRNRKAAGLLALVAFALVVAACGGDDDDDTTTTSATDETTTTVDAGGDTTTTAADTSTTAGGDTTTTAGDGAAAGHTGLTKIDDSTFTIELSAPDPEYSLRLGYAAFFPLPSVALEDPVAFEEAPIGNGPFMMDGTWEHDIRIPMVPFPEYAGDTPAQLDNLEFTIYADTNTAYTDVQAGNLDFLKVVPTDFAGTYQADFPDRNAEFYDTSFTYLGIPTYVEELTLDHRRALSMAIDRELVMDTIFANTRDAAHSVVPPILFGRDDVCPNWNYDPEAARELWEAAGDPGPITVWFNSGAGHETWVEAVVNLWGQNLGLDTSTVTFESLDFAEYLPVVDAGEPSTGMGSPTME